MHERRSSPPQRPEQQGSSEQHLKGLLEHGAQQLVTELQQGKSERLHQYLSFASRFHRYSPSNQFLIYLQKPKATYVAGYKTWQRMGHQVAKGEQGIRILAPRFYTRVNEQTGEEEEHRSFVSVALFDASQLATIKDKPLPSFFSPLADDQQALCARLEQAVRSDGITLAEAEATQRGTGLQRRRHDRPEEWA